MTNFRIIDSLKLAKSDLTKTVRKDSPKCIFIVTGKRSYKNSGAETLLSTVAQDYQCVRFSNFGVNPGLEDVERGIALFREHDCDYIIAIGGGSTIDMAKLVNVGQAHEMTMNHLVTNPNSICKRGKSLIAIPTTSGTGSEATHFAVVYLGKVKYSLGHPEFVLPEKSMIVPPLTYSMSPYQTAVSGLDALSQAIEGYWSIHSTPESNKFAKEAIELILKALPAAVKDGNHIARKEMSTASLLAGRTINITKTTGAHAMSYALTSYFGIPHGHAVALTLGEWFLYNGKVSKKNVADNRGVDHVRNTMEGLYSIIGVKDSKEACGRITALINEVGLESKLSDLTIKKSDIDLIVNKTNLDRMKNNPVSIDNEGLKGMLLNVL